MKHFTTTQELRNYLASLPKHLTIGFVPTMGALHDGHLSLVETAKKETDVVVCSIFVNPTQFNNKNDLENYPINLDKDLVLLERSKCDVIFSPSVNEVYPNEPQESFNFGDLETVMEGISRPGHFNGVAQVVKRFFEIVEPNRAFFGSKDFQQLAIIRALIKKMEAKIEIVACKTIRENNGLAMSSRNMRLTSADKREAGKIFTWLNQLHSFYIKQTPLNEAKQSVLSEINKSKRFKLDYLEVVHSDTLQPVKSWQQKGNTVCCIAVYLDDVRLIDNILF